MKNTRSKKTSRFRIRARRKQPKALYLPADAKPTHRVHDVYCPQFLLLPTFPELHRPTSIQGGAPSAQDEG